MTRAGTGSQTPPGVVSGPAAADRRRLHQMRRAAVHPGLACSTRCWVGRAGQGRSQVMKYLLLLNRVDDALPEPRTAAAETMLREYAEAVQAMAEAGVLVDCAPLTATSAATTVRVRDGVTVLTDGPAAELREQVGGYTIIDCPDLDDALKWAAAMPAARDSSVEVHTIVDTGRNH